MSTLQSLDIPRVRGEATLRVINPQGECTQEVSGKNLLNYRFWDALITAEDSNNWSHRSSTLFNIRTYIGAEKHVPIPQAAYAHMLGEGTDHPLGVFRTGAEPVTDYPWIQVRNLYQVTGTARTIYSIGLTNNTGVPENDIDEYRLATSRLLLPEPVVQGENDQLDLLYRLYFEEDPNSETHPAYWADFVYWAMTQTTDTYLGYIEQNYYGFALGMAGVGYSQRRASFHLPVVPQVDSEYGGVYTRVLEGRSQSDTNEPIGSRSRNATANIYWWSNKITTNRKYYWGDLFNEWWPRDLGFDIRNADWLGSDSGYQGSYAYGASLHRLAKFHKSETSSIGPFHNSFNHAPDSQKLIYDVNRLPQTTWRAVFGGNWPSTDRIPLFARLWWSDGGPVDGSTAKYKLGFVRTLGTTRGLARDQVEDWWGLDSTQGGCRLDSGYSYMARKMPGQAVWTHSTDLLEGHAEFANSRFGNLGNYNRSGHAASNSGHAWTGYSYLICWNVRKMPGLTMNTWWGWQSGKYGKSSHLGVEWRRLYPLQRVVWQKQDISSNLNQIDWLEPINGMPGEIDEEMALICDKTSGIYLLNATQNTVTQITDITGFDQCTFSRDPDTGAHIYTAITYDNNRTIITDNTIGFSTVGYGLFNRTGRIAGDRLAANSTDNGVKYNFYSIKDHARYGAPIQYIGSGNWPSDVVASSLITGDRIVRGVYYFDGNYDSLIAQNHQNGTFTLAGSDDFTFEIWFYRTSIRDNEWLADFGCSVGSPGSGSVYINTGRSGGVLWNGTSICGPIYTNEDPGTNSWQNITIVRENGTVSVYKNGLLFGSAENITSGAGGSNRTLSIGNIPGGYWTYQSWGIVGYVHSWRATRAARYTGEFTPTSWAGNDGPTDDPLYEYTLTNFYSEADPLGLSTAGSGYADGVYPEVVLSGGAGTGATASVQVSSGGMVRLSLADRGTGYAVGDVLTAELPPQANPQAGEILTLDQDSLIGGGGYADGSYPGVSLQGGSGSGASADIEIVAGVISSVTLTSGGTGFAAGELLFADDSSLGGSGLGSGFSIDVGSVDEDLYLPTTPATVVIEGLENLGNSVLAEQAHRIVMIRRHWRHPNVFVGLFGSGNTLYSFYTSLDSDDVHDGYSSNAPASYSVGIGEFFGDAGENGTGISVVDLSQMTAANYRELVWSDWITFEPNGQWARVQSLEGNNYESMASKNAWFVCTSKFNPSRYSERTNEGRVPWAAAHSIRQIPNTENPLYPHHIITNVLDADDDTSTRGVRSRDLPYIIRGGSRNDGVTYANRGDIASNIGVGNNPENHVSQGYNMMGLPKQGASIALHYDDKGSGFYTEDGYERYKGLAVDGQTMTMCAPMWCNRESGNTATQYTGIPAAWPIDSDSDTVIPHPLRWDIYGWDSANAKWVREEWGYNYTAHRWEVDPNTVFPGRPAPANGGTHTLESIEQDAYNGLTVEFVDVRPEDTNDPLLGEWSGQYIYNGCVFDGINQYTFQQIMSSRPVVRSAISQVIPASGRIRISESYDKTYIWLALYDTDLFDFKLDGVDAQAINNGYSVPSEGVVGINHYELIFNPADVGKTLTGYYTYLKHPDGENPQLYVNYNVDREDAIDGTVNGLLGGAGVKDSATLVTEGWTLQHAGNSAGYINAADFAAVLPSGFPYFRERSPYVETGEYAERLFFSRDCIGFFFTDESSAISLYRDYGSNTSGSGNPTYGGVQFMYDDSHSLKDIHTILHTDANSDDFLIVRVQWYYGSTATEDINCELWINLNKPFEYQWRIGNWNKPNSTYAGTTRYMGITRRSSGGSYWNHPVLWPWGLGSTYNSTGNPQNFTPWGGPGSDEWAHKKFIINFDPAGYEDP